MPEMDESKWRETLSCALDISSRGILPQHISSYQLSVEPGSALARLVERGKWSEASDDFCSRQYEILCETLSSAGYNHYEISNFARPGFEARHNSAYWRHVPYVGLGPGAHSYIIRSEPVSACDDSSMKIRKWNAPDLNAYLDAARKSGFQQICDEEVLSSEQYSLEHVMLGLRTSEGVESSLLELYCNKDGLAAALAAGHLVMLPSGRIRIPESCFFISDSIIADIV
jgi:oxygen-independent coproporphyrinogen-3 oxidase